MGYSSSLQRVARGAFDAIRVKSNHPNKDGKDVVCVYSGTKFTSKLQAKEHKCRGCKVELIVNGYKNPGEGSPMYPNLKTMALVKQLEQSIFSGVTLPIRN